MDPEGERLEQMMVEDLDLAILEPGRETPSRRRKCAAQAEEIDELDDLMLMWANHYHSNPALTPVEISLSGLLNTFVSYMSPGQCWEIIISLFK